MAENYFGITDKGRIRDNNEDNFIAEPVMKGSMIAACVIDGVGGYEGGEIAAAIAKESILKKLQSGSGNIFHTLKEALVSANKNIYTEKRETSANQAMACVVTLALVDVANNRFYYVHVGDTRLYLFRDQSLVKITRDQSFVGFLEDSGRLTEEEAMNHPKRNEINKALGFDNQIEVQKDYIDSGESPFLPGDIILLCSDGLSDMIGSNEITSLLNSKTSLREKAEALVSAANQAGGKDNITVVLVRNEKKPLKQKATKPVLIKKNRPADDNIPAVEEKPVEKPLTAPPRKNNGKLILMLVIISLLSLAASVWLFREHFIKNNEPAPVPYKKNSIEIKLQDSLSQSLSDTIHLSAANFGDSIFLSDSILINRPVLFLKGPVTFYRDSNYKRGGPALVLGPLSRHIVLDSISFHGFELAIIAHDPSVLQMKDLSFPNTRLSVAYAAGAQQLIAADTTTSRNDSLIQREN